MQRKLNVNLRSANSALLRTAISSMAIASLLALSPATQAAPPAGSSVQVAFSPDGNGEALVIAAIDSAHRSIRLAAYSFTSPVVVQALLNAKRRGVDIAAVVDYKNNMVEDRSGKAHAALNLLVNAGIPVRTIRVYPIHHDKYIIIDGVTTETGSFNYSEAAARRNSENVMVVWNTPGIAAQYLPHWTDRWNKGEPYSSSF